MSKSPLGMPGPARGCAVALLIEVLIAVGIVVVCAFFARWC